MYIMHTRGHITPDSFWIPLNWTLGRFDGALTGSETFCCNSNKNWTNCGEAVDGISLDEDNVIIVHDGANKSPRLLELECWWKIGLLHILGVWFTVWIHSTLCGNTVVGVSMSPEFVKRQTGWVYDLNNPEAEQQSIITKDPTWAHIPIEPSVFSFAIKS